MAIPNFSILHPYPNITTAIDLFTYPRTVIGDFWGVLLLSIILIIFTSYFNSYERINKIEEAIIASSFITTILSILMAGMNIISANVVFFPMILTGVTGMVLYINSRSNV